MDKQKLNDFLEELSQLTEKYSMFIGGCGCCGSPYVESNGKYIGEFLKWDTDTNKYTIKIIENELLKSSVSSMDFGKNQEDDG